MTTNDTQRLLERLTEALPQPHKARSLPQLIHEVEAFGVEAGKLERELSARIQGGATPEITALLHRMSRALGDASLGIKHAIGGMTAAARAQVAR